MAVSLVKGQKVSLAKTNDNSLTSIMVGLGWDEAKRKRGLFQPKPIPIDCDASALLLKNDILEKPEDIVFYGNLRHFSNAVIHCGDNLTGEGDGDDEKLIIDLVNLPLDVNKVVFVVNIYDALKRQQHFGMIQNAFIRICDANKNIELCRYNLSENYEGRTAMIFGEVYRYKDEWKFNAIGQATNDLSLQQTVARYIKKDN